MGLFSETFLIPVIQGGLLLFAVMLVVLNIVIDLIYARLDPRIRYGHEP